MMKEYRKKPITIKAILWDGERSTMDSIMRLTGQSLTLLGECCYIDTLEGRMTASLGDYIIQGIQGELYPCKPEIFLSTYEEIV